MIIDESGGNVTLLPTPKRPKRPPGAALEVVQSYDCQHGSFKVDEKLSEVICGLCKAKLSPIWVLLVIARDDARLRQRWAEMKAEIELMKPRLQTKCQHCSKLTRIPSNVKSWDVTNRAVELMREATDGQ